MKSILLGALLACAAIPAQADITVEASNGMKDGWMADGWGSYRFVIRNTGSKPVKAVKWTAQWEAKGKKMPGEGWGGPLDLEVPPGGQIVKDEVGHLSADLVKAASPSAPRMVGTFTFEESGKTFDVNYSIEVPEAKLPEPLKVVEGRTAGMALMESRFTEFKNIDRTLRWVDEAYAQMIDLTGETPYDGKKMIFKEAPEHPWWAYAGQEMILNRKFVGSTLQEFDDGIISFGWIHEVGHNFDVLGDWYIWSGPAAEWQANFKLGYAFETMPDQTFRINWQYAPGYPCPEKKVTQTGTELVERFFLLFGDSYLADASRTWDTLSSDEMHGFFQRIQRVYGWEPFRQWYRTYRRLENEGKKKPESEVDKVNLIAAILSKETKADLVPLFQRWRFPVTSESVGKVAKTYGIELPKAAS